MKIRFINFNTILSTGPQVRILGLLVLLLAFIVPAIIAAQDTSKNPPEATTPVGTITDVSVAHEKAGDFTVTVATDSLLTPKEFRLDNPPRLVFDFPNAENKVDFYRLPVNTASIKQIRVSQFRNSDPKIVRVVFDLGKDCGPHEVALDRTSVRVVFHQKKNDPAAESADNKRDLPVARSTKARPVAGSPAVSAKKGETGIHPQAGPSKAPTVTPVRNSVPPTPSSKATLQATDQSGKSEPQAHKAAQAPLVAALASAPAPAPAPAVVRAGKTGPSTTPTNPPVRNSVSSAPSSKVLQAGQSKKSEPQARRAVQAPLVAALASASAPAVVQAGPVTRPTSRFSGQPLTLDLVDIPLVDFFRLMAEEGGINIVLDPEVKGTISIKVVKLPWDQIFDASLVNNDLDKQVEGNLIRIAHKSTLQNEAKQKEALKKARLLAADLETRIKRLNYAKASSIVEALDEQKTVRGTVVVDERTNSLILTDIPSSLDKLTELIETLDTPQPQVEIEARIVSATRDFARDIGVQFGFVAGNLQRVTVGGPNTGRTLPTPTPLGGTSETDTKSESLQPTGNYNVNLPSTLPFGGAGISVGNIFDTFLLDAAITAGETKGRAKLISQPKVTAQNNSPAVITQGLRFPVPVVANNTVSVQFFNAALTLTVTPQITYEGNIVLDLKVENNSPDFARSVDGIPSIRTSESSTRILISDGGTTVIGGILLDDDSTQQDRIPGLGSLPLLGNLFRRSFVSRSTQEVLFFVTPRIIK